MLIAESDDLRMGDKKPRAAAVEPGPPWILGDVPEICRVVARTQLVASNRFAFKRTRTNSSLRERERERDYSALRQITDADRKLVLAPRGRPGQSVSASRS